MIKNFSQYLVEENREVFFTFGRMNPPTIGHGKLIDALVKKSKGADYKIYVSQSQDAKKNPLSYSDKIKHLRKMFPKNGRNIIVDKTAKNAIDIAVKLYDMGYKKITMVVGDDQIRTFDVLLNKYNGKKARHGFYNFESINVVSAGRRDPDAEGVEGMSATKMRKAATDNDYSTFAQGIPNSMSDKDTRRLFNDVRKGLGLKEERSFKRHVDLGKLDDTREAYVEGKLFELGDTVVIKESEEVGVVSVLGANYVIVECGDKKLRKWLDAVELVEKKAAQDPDIKDKEGTQPAKYHKGLEKSTKSKRDAHFKKHGKKDDDDSSAYKPAPGDATAKTKPSKYTKAFKDMYDEDNDPCWDTHKQVGMKTKNGKQVPNCVRKESLDERVFGKTGPFGNKGGSTVLFKGVDKFLDKVVNGKQYKKAVRAYLDWRRKNPNKGATGAWDFFRRYGVESPRQMVDYFDQMVKKGILPAHLGFDKKLPKSKTVFPDEPMDIDKFKRGLRAQKEDAVKQAKDAISREKEQDKQKHDRLLDRARLARAKTKNRETKPND